MKTPTQIQTQIEKLQQQLAQAKAKEREQRIGRFLSILDKSDLSDDEAVAAIEAAVLAKRGGQ